MIHVASPEVARQVVLAAKGVLALVVGIVVGNAIMFGTVYFGHWLDMEMRSREFGDQLFLGGLLLGLALIALGLTAVGMAARRLPGWLSAFLLGAAAAPPLSVFAVVFFLIATWD